MKVFHFYRANALTYNQRSKWLLLQRSLITNRRTKVISISHSPSLKLQLVIYELPLKTANQNGIFMKLEIEYFKDNDANPSSASYTT